VAPNLALSPTQNPAQNRPPNMAPEAPTPATAADDNEYERNQRYNALVAWLHSLRYRRIVRLFAGLAAAAGERPLRVVEIGCGHGKLFAVLNQRFAIDYTGIELEADYVAAAHRRYGDAPNFTLLHASATRVPECFAGADVIVALETFEHIPEHEVVRVIEAIAAARPRLLVCSVPVEIGPAIWLKNLGSLLTGYVRHREYSWTETFWAGLYQLDRLPPHGTGHKGFDWRWLAQTIRHNLQILRLYRLPVPVLPAAFAFSLFFVAAPRD